MYTRFSLIIIVLAMPENFCSFPVWKKKTIHSVLRGPSRKTYTSAKMCYHQIVYLPNTTHDRTTVLLRFHGCKTYPGGLLP